MNVPHNAPEFADVLRRAHEARDARAAAEREWHEAREALRAAADAGTLPANLRGEVNELLQPDEQPHQHRRWRPSPS
jgi:hypothetical protein